MLYIHKKAEKEEEEESIHLISNKQHLNDKSNRGNLQNAVTASAAGPSMT